MRTSVLVGVGCICMGLGPLHADQLFYSLDNGEIWRANLDGSYPRQILDRPNDWGHPALEYSSYNERLYWSEHHAGIISSDACGRNVETLLGPENDEFDPQRIDAHAIALDQNMLYWGQPGYLGRVQLDGTNLQGKAVEVNDTLGVDVDSAVGHVYWLGYDGVQRSGPELQNVEVVATFDVPSAWGQPLYDFEVDTIHHKMYWTAHRSGIFRTDLDGTNIEVLVDEEVHALAIHEEAGVIYYSRGNSVFRANLDGTDPTHLLHLEGAGSDVRIRKLALGRGVPSAPGDSCLRGDFDADHLLAAADIDLLAAAIRGKSTESRFDLTKDTQLDLADHAFWVTELKRTYIGDANLDGEFNSGDLVAVFQEGKYEIEQDAGWAEGDWNGDGLFGSGDLVFAFQIRAYEQGPRTATRAVPEPKSLVTILTALATVLVANRGSYLRGLRHRNSSVVWISFGAT